MSHAHLGYFGSEYDCRICNPVCGGRKHQWGLDLGTRTPEGKIILTMSTIPCGHPGCPVLKYTKYPFRIRMLRLKGFRLPPIARKADRSTAAGNPYKLKDCDCGLVKGLHGHDREESIKLFRKYAIARLKREQDWLEPWRGKCPSDFCKVDEACHCDIVIELANRPRSSGRSDFRGWELSTGPKSLKRRKVT